jgi:hypothetical protein
MRGLLQLRASQNADTDRGPGLTDAAARLRFRDTQIEMPHGAGGKASSCLVGDRLPFIC